MAYRQQRRNQISKTFKDYLVPIIGAVLVIILLFSFFGGDNTTPDNENLENTTGYPLEFGSADTEVFIEYTGGNKEEVDSGTEIFRGEKLIVREGTVEVNIGDTEINIDKIGELKLNEDGTYSFFSSNLFFSSESSQEIQMRYANIQTTGASVLSLAQNEVGSTIYVINGTAEIESISGASTILGKGQKISISSSETSQEDLDLASKKTDFDDFFIGSDWFLQNNGPALLAIQDTSPLATLSGSSDSSTGTTTVSSSSQRGLIRVINLDDEDSVSTETVDIDGTFTNPNISKITAGNQAAVIDSEEKTFRISGVDTSESVNDIVLKVYGSDDEILGKEVYTVYGSGGSTGTQASNNGPLFKVENYSLDETEFQFISPKPNPYTTQEGVVMIEGRVPVGIVRSITVNGYTLQKFPQYGTYWTYFANQEFGNLKDGLNIYEIKYIDENGGVLHSNAYTIIKEEPSVSQDNTDTTSTEETTDETVGEEV